MKGHWGALYSQRATKVIKSIRALGHYWGHWNHPSRVLRGPWGHLAGSMSLKSTLQNAALRKEKEVRRVLGNAFGGGGLDNGADMNVNEEGQCPARIANHKRQVGKLAPGQGLHDLDLLKVELAWLFWRTPPVCVRQILANTWLFLFSQEFPLPFF